MSVLLVSVMAAFIAGPLLTQNIFRAAFEHERVQIEVDNAAIVMGRRWREAIRIVQVARRTVSALELAHHVAHLCALTGEPECVATDKGLEKKLEGIVQLAEMAARERWAAGWRGLGNRVLASRAPAAAPVKKENCPVCGMPLQLVWEENTFPLRLMLRSSTEEAHVFLCVIEKPPEFYLVTARSFMPEECETR